MNCLKARPRDKRRGSLPEDDADLLCADSLDGTTSTPAPQQEHAMKAKNGGKGMTDEQVEAFIARYMPGYECFLGGVSSAAAPWAGRGLQLILDTRRAVVEQTQF